MTSATNPQSARTARGPLTGLKVIDIGQLVAGPLAATLLADFGADVVKVERPEHGDPGREMGSKKDGISLWWKVGARNKRSIALDLKDEQDRDVLFRLVAEADVMVENFSPGTLEKLGLGFEVLSQHNPSLILLSISGFGQTGPRRNWRGFGRTAEAFSGLAYTTGYPDSPPIHLAFPVADCVSGVMGAMSAMIAVYERDRNPQRRGQRIDLSLFETVFRVMEFVAINYDQLGEVLERTGAQSTYVAPVNTWSTKDGKWASFTGSTQAIVTRMFEAMGQPELIVDPRFSSNAARLANAQELDELMAAWMGDHTLDAIMAKFEAHDVPIAPVYSIREIFEEPHYWAREALITVDDPDLGPVSVQGVTPKFSRTPGRVRWLGHHLDSDHDSVLADWLAESPTRPA
jgi:crotonobetainyl-CoA:carnitine CoA-transferase CaiB-like acyl-CoA transferase